MYMLDYTVGSEHWGKRPILSIEDVCGYSYDCLHLSLTPRVGFYSCLHSENRETEAYRGQIICPECGTMITVQKWHLMFYLRCTEMDELNDQSTGFVLCYRERDYGNWESKTLQTCMSPQVLCLGGFLLSIKRGDYLESSIEDPVPWKSSLKHKVHAPEG